MLRITIAFSLICLSFTGFSQRAEEFTQISMDGAWCWFSDPRAVYQESTGLVYTSWISSEGDVYLSSRNNSTGFTNSVLIYKNLEVDDHDNPSILLLPDGNVMTFFTKHGGKIYYTRSGKPGDIQSMEKLDSLDYGPRSCYTNPVLLTEENNRIYLFFRGGQNWKPSFITSDDLGRTWSADKTMVSKSGNDLNNRPYTKVVSDGKSSIHFAFTDGHPREENHNSIYYLKYEKGKFYEANGKLVGQMSELPLRQEKLSKAYDGQKNNQRAWIWDIAIDEKNRPILAFSTLPEETRHLYHYSYWNGDKWMDKVVCPAGSAFPRFVRPKEARDPEPHYSGGIALDHTNPHIVYTSRPINDRFEIEKWTFVDDDKAMESESITISSLRDNIRPFAVRNMKAGEAGGLLWMNIRDYEHYTRFHTSLYTNIPGKKFGGHLDKYAVTEAMEAVADWQISQTGSVKHHPLDWTNGALYTGMMSLAKVSDKPKYLEWLAQIGRKFSWQPYFRMYHADDLVVSQMYLDMYRLKQKNKDSYRILMPTQARLDYVISHPSVGSLLLNYGDAQTLERWSWCDALFMAPPVYTKMYQITGDEKYLDFMDQEYKATYDFLYDKDESLFYRDYRFFPDKKLEENGKKVFWGRGNGWVVAGLAIMLEELPSDHKLQGFYKKLFVDMIQKIASLQGEDGFWHASLLDPGAYPSPEVSSTAFFTYAMAFGINQGWLNKSEFQARIEKAWIALNSAIFPDGKLGWIQPIGEDPKKVTSEMTEVYGVGGFLLAGTEILKSLH